MAEIDSEDLSYFSAFEKITGVMPTDYINTAPLLIFLVDPSELGRAIAKKGMNIEKLRSAFRKKVVIVGDSKDLETFVRQLFSNIAILSIDSKNIMGQQAITLTIEEKDRGIAIGKEGERIKAAKLLLEKKFNASLHLKTRRSINSY